MVKDIVYNYVTKTFVKQKFPKWIKKLSNKQRVSQKKSRKVILTVYMIHHPNWFREAILRAVAKYNAGDWEKRYPDVNRDLADSAINVLDKIGRMPHEDKGVIMNNPEVNLEKSEFENEVYTMADVIENIKSGNDEKAKQGIAVLARQIDQTPSSPLWGEEKGTNTTFNYNGRRVYQKSPPDSITKQ